MNEIKSQEERRLTVVPATCVVEESGKVLVWVELPGVAQKDLEIRVEGQELTVMGRRDPQVSHGDWLLRERQQGDFLKSFSVDGSIDLEKIEAKLSQGVLSLILPMKEAAKPKSIEIRSA